MLKLMYPFGFIECAPACLETLLEAIEVRQYQDLISLSKASRPDQGGTLPSCNRRTQGDDSQGHLSVLLEITALKRLCRGPLLEPRRRILWAKDKLHSEVVNHSVGLFDAK